VNECHHFFIVGYPRSGTTLLSSILNGHPTVAVAPETHFFRKFWRPALRRTDDLRGFVQAFVDAPRVRDLSLSADELMMFSEDFENEHERVLLAGLDQYAAKRGKTICGEKTPAHALHLQKILSTYPNVRAIGLIRDARDCVLSNLKQSWTHNNPEKHAAEWSRYSEKLRQAQVEYPGRVRLVRFEDLLSDTELTVRAVDEFVGVSFDKCQLRSRPTDGVIPSWEKNWKAKSSEFVDANRKFAWRENGKQETLARVTQICRRELRYWGYATDNLSRVETSKKIKWWLCGPVYQPLLYRWIKRLLEVETFSRLKAGITGSN